MKDSKYVLILQEFNKLNLNWKRIVSKCVLLASENKKT